MKMINCILKIYLLELNNIMCWKSISKTSPNVFAFYVFNVLEVVIED